MSNSIIRKLVLSLILTLGSLFTLPSYAWPEVDHMNMCGAAIKTSRAYAGNFKGWQSRDQYVANNRRVGYYYRTNCPGTVAPVKKVVRKKARKVRRSKRRYTKKCNYGKRCSTVKRSKKRKSVKKRVKKKYPRIARSSKARKFKRKVKYDLHADCVRVDRVNASGPVVRFVHKH